MKNILKHIGVMALIGLFSGCATGSSVVGDGTAPPTPAFTELLTHADQYKGRPVILGGYVVEVMNEPDQSKIIAVQTPLGSGQRPKSKDLSEGRVVFVYAGFIDPEVYTNGRQITVSGDVLAAFSGDQEMPYPYLQVQVREIFLWPVEKTVEVNPRWDSYRYYYPYPWWYGYPYSWYDHRYYRSYRR